jgi:mRNA interferase RelE/StbE
VSDKVWRVEIDPRALKELRKLDPAWSGKILNYISKRLRGAGDPRQLGKAMTGELKGHWRYRVGDVRIVARIDDDQLFIMVITVAHRRDVYR